MKVECLIKRTGDTPIILGNVKYMFNPLPWITDQGGNRVMTKPGEPTTSVCEVNQSEHLQYLLGSPQFREYQEGQPAPETGRDEENVINLSGYSIPRYMDKGHIVMDGKRKRFAGSDGQWKESNKDLIPFESEFAAFQWLKEEARMDEPIEEEGRFPCRVEGCGKKCKNEAGRASHEQSHKQ